jgi:DNA-binding LytR/AlgR family response regulator
MRILIIEDEQIAAEGLCGLLKDLLPEAEISGVADSISATERWLQEHAAPDLAFADIHLADGSSLEHLSEQLRRFPVIFTTAYDEHALKAFETGSIAYLLKPIRKQELATALEKLRMLRPQPVPDKAEPSKAQSLKNRFMIRYGDHIRTVQASEIAYAYTENKATYLRTNDGRAFLLDMNMDALESSLDPKQFFRINRQYIVSLQGISEMKAYTKGRVLISLNPQAEEQPVVSVERAADFKKWLDDE